MPILLFNLSISKQSPVLSCAAITSSFLQIASEHCRSVNVPHTCHLCLLGFKESGQLSQPYSFTIALSPELVVLFSHGDLFTLPIAQKWEVSDLLGYEWVIGVRALFHVPIIPYICVGRNSHTSTSWMHPSLLRDGKWVSYREMSELSGCRLYRTSVWGAIHTHRPSDRCWGSDKMHPWCRHSDFDNRCTYETYRHRVWELAEPDYNA